mmetsp:Transcript_24585/g.31264  ORF Transcript_24585/g.31264 Transcript_24585/m.31264 type:complete len:228 (-) Transcript_24585:3-686(-)
MQAKIYKKWITVCESLTQMKDYNSAVQVINGLRETSIGRLPHLTSNLSIKWTEKLERLRNIYGPEQNFRKYRALSQTPPCIPFVGCSLKDLVYAYDGNPNKLESGAINFHKSRIIAQIVLSLKDTDYSFLKFNPQVAQALLNVTPWDQEALYQRSVAISQSLAAQAKECEDNALLKKDNKLLREEIEKLKRENEALKSENETLKSECEKKDELISNIKWKLKQQQIE